MAKKAKDEEVKKRKKKVEEDEPKKKKRKVVEDSDEDDVGTEDSGFDPYAAFDNEMERIERQVQVMTGLEEGSNPMSTGVLAMDLIWGGGLKPSWLTHLGGEQSCKTTTAIHVLAAAVKEEIPLISFWDYEGSTASSQDYVESIFKSCGLKMSVREIFGTKDPKTGKWVVRPAVRYQSATVGEQFFDYLAELLRTLPDKKFLGGEWWYRYDDTKENQSKYGEYANKSMPKKYGKGIYIPAKDGKLQAVVLTDSYPAMNPSDNDDEESNNSLALNARMFSKHLPRVKGRLVAKRVVVLGINQLRSIPMARYGPTEMEPCGQALRYNSDGRLKHTSRAISGAPLWPKADKEDYSVEKEPSATVDGAYDTYRYIHIKPAKNKLSTPGRSSWLRLWVEDGNGTARGFDPVFDTLYYLTQTGQLIGKGRKSIYLNLHKLGQTKQTNWETLKAWILGPKQQKKDICEKLGIKPIDLRAFCFKQMRDGVAETLYIEAKNAKASKKGTNDEDGDDE